MTTKAGQLITDGNAVWILDDVRDGARVGDIILRPTLRDGYIKANGATVKASEYPRLLAWAQASNMTVTAEQYATDCSKYVYDADADTLVLPNAVGRVLQGGEQVRSVEAGLPDITGVLFGGGVNASGAFYKTWTTDAFGNGSDIHNDWHQGAAFAASRSNPIYGASDTVQPPAIALIAQIKY